jgi:hypothetical protein
LHGISSVTVVAGSPFACRFRVGGFRVGGFRVGRLPVGGFRVGRLPVGGLRVGLRVGRLRVGRFACRRLACAWLCSAVRLSCPLDLVTARRRFSPPCIKVCPSADRFG